jgi:hypothetical protein
MKKIFFLAILVLILFSCKKEPATGDLFISTEYESVGEENVEVWLYESYDKFMRYEYLDKQFSDEYGEIYFYELDPGWYYIEAEKQKSSMFKIYAMDSVEISAGIKTNKILILGPVD